MARLKVYCHDCRTYVRGSLFAHKGTDKHRAIVYRLNTPWSLEKRERPTRRRYADQYRVSEDEERAAMERMEREYAARMAGPGPEWIEPGDEPEAGTFVLGPAMQPTIIARDGGKPEPCPRCGRADFRTAVGRTWHLENNPDCSKYRRPDRHHYAAA